MKLLDCFFVSISQLIPRMNSFKRKACVSVFTVSDDMHAGPCFFFKCQQTGELIG
jgi:hypothetical protein